MAILTEGARKAAYIIEEAFGSFRSRGDGIVTAPAGGYEAGTILGQITATLKYVQVDPAATDGSEVAAAILYGNLPETGDQMATLTLRASEVNSAALIYPDGATQPQIDTIDAQLAAGGVIVKEAI